MSALTDPKSHDDAVDQQDALADVAALTIRFMQTAAVSAGLCPACVGVFVVSALQHVLKPGGVLVHDDGIGRPEGNA